MKRVLTYTSDSYPGEFSVNDLAKVVDDLRTLQWSGYATPRVVLSDKGPARARAKGIKQLSIESSR